MTTIKTTRRQAIALGLGIASAGACFALNGLNKHNRQAQLFAAKSQDFAVDGNTALKERAAAKKLLYGAATSYFKLNLDANFATSFLRECAILMAEGDLLWCAMRPTIETFNFARSDWFVEFAHSQNMVCGATHLVWHQCLPSWFKDGVNQQNAQKVMVDHIKTVVGRYAGQIHFWSVVNEAVNPGDGRDDGLVTSTPWLEFLGPNYFDIAFRTAAEADPNALLLFNENDLEFDNAYQEKKRTALLKLLERLKTQGTPVHALGIQAHLNTDKGEINPTKLKAFLHDVAQLGLEIVVTEMDVIDQDLPTDINLRDRMVAQMYENFLSAVLDEPATSGVITWGLSDRLTWLSATKRNDGTSVRPLPLDAQLNRKLAWNAIARAFDQAPQHDGSSKLWDAWSKLNQAKK